MDLEETHCREEMEENALAEDWATNIESEVQKLDIPVQLDIQIKGSILRMPEGFGHSGRKDAYKPKLVSFGPYHHNNPQLIPMEEHKQRALVHFLKRANKHVQDCIDVVDRVVQELMDCYDKLDKEWRERRSFLKLMIHDGCFMLEILRSNDPQTNNVFGDKDPIFSKQGSLWKLPHIRRDMLLVENQLPLLLLKTLIAFEMGKSPDDESINKLVNKHVINFFVLSTTPNTEMGQHIHVLDVVRKSMLQESIDQDTSFWQKMRSGIFNHYQSIHLDASTRQSRGQEIFNPDSPTPKSEDANQEVIWPATQLQEGGIKFKSRKTKSPKAIEFTKGFLFFRGILHLPIIEVDDATESKFLNLMAFEQLHLGAGTEVSSYVSFMDNIIDTEGDVTILNKNKILKNFVGTDRAVADLFNGLAYDVPIDPDSTLGRVHRDVIYYCRKPWHRWLANLRHTYFSSPWSSCSVLAAIVLLGLTVTQTWYTVLGYYHPN